MACPTSVLLLVIHGGTVLDHGIDQAQTKTTDLATFSGTIDLIVRQHYPALHGHLVTKLVPCPAICAEALAVLSNLSPFGFQSSPSFDGTTHGQDPLPMTALPLFACSTPEYDDHLSTTIGALNGAYQEFLKSTEGFGFNGQVVLIGDSLGSVLAFDAICRTVNHSSDGAGSHFGSESSLQESKSNPLISISNDAEGEEVIRKNAGSGSATGNNAAGATTTGSAATGGGTVGMSGPETSDSSQSSFFDATSFQKLLSAQVTPGSKRRRSNSGGPELKLDFEASDLFMFGSPMALILSYRKMVSGDEKANPIPKPGNTQVSQRR